MKRSSSLFVSLVVILISSQAVLSIENLPPSKLEILNERISRLQHELDSHQTNRLNIENTLESDDLLIYVKFLVPNKFETINLSKTKTITRLTREQAQEAIGNVVIDYCIDKKECDLNSKEALDVGNIIFSDFLQANKINRKKLKNKLKKKYETIEALQNKILKLRGERKALLKETYKNEKLSQEKPIITPSRKQPCPKNSKECRSLFMTGQLNIPKSKLPKYEECSQISERIKACKAGKISPSEVYNLPKKASCDEMPKDCGGLMMKGYLNLNMRDQKRHTECWKISDEIKACRKNLVR